MSDSTKQSRDEGFDHLYIRSDTTGTESGDTKSESGTPQPERRATPIDGFDSASPFDIIDSGTGNSGSFGSGPTGKRRGRPLGSKNRTSTEKTTPIYLGANLERTLTSLHFFASKWFDDNGWELDPTEAKRYSDALQEFAKYHPIPLDPKRMSLVNLLITIAEIEGTRAYAMWMKSKQQKPKIVPTPIRDDKQQTQSQRVNGAAENVVPLSPSQIWNEAPIEEPL